MCKLKKTLIPDKKTACHCFIVAGDYYIHSDGTRSAVSLK